MNIMKEAHKLTKEIKAEYPNVDYMAQLGICIAYLSENKGEIKMVELKGSEKQIKWAEEILEVVKPAMEIILNQMNVNLEKYTGTVTEEKINKIAKVYNNINQIANSEDAGIIIKEFKDYCITNGKVSSSNCTDLQAAIEVTISHIGEKAEEKEMKSSNIAKQARKEYRKQY